MILLLEDAGLHLEVLQCADVAFFFRGALALDRMWCILNALHCNGL